MPFEDPLAFCGATHVKSIANVFELNVAIEPAPATGAGAANEKTGTEDVAAAEAPEALLEDEAVVEASSPISLMASESEPS